MQNTASNPGVSADTVARAVAAFLIEDCSFPGASVCVRTPEEQACACAGVAIKDPVRPMDPTDRFYIASVTKTFVAALILKLVEAGELRLDTLIRDLVPPDLLEEILRSRPVEPITVQHLLQHCSGIRDVGTVSTHIEAYRRSLHRPIRPVTLREALALSRHSDFRPRPGLDREAPLGRYAYSHINVELLGVIIETLVKRPLPAFMEEQILRPLQLHATSWGRLHHPEQPYPPDLTAGYTRINPRPDEERDLEEEWNAMDWHYALYSDYLVGSMVSSPLDLCTFFYALLAEQTLISPALVARMTEDTIPTSDLRPWERCGLGLFGRVHPFTYWHNGLMIGFKATALYVPETRTLITACVNGDWPTGQGLASWLLAHLQEYGCAECF